MTESIHPEHPDLVRLLDLWRQKRPAGALPGRAMFDPIELIDLADGGRFRVRLHGSRLVDQMRHDHTGRFLDEWPYQPAKNDLLQACAAVLEGRRPHVVSGKFSAPGPVAYEALWLPLAADGRTIDMLMCGKQYGHRR